MKKNYSTPPSLTLSPTSLQELEPVRRLIILIPDMESDYNPAIRRIWELATAQGADVLLLSLCKDPIQELRLRRMLVTMCAMVQDGRVHAEANVEIGKNWMDVIKRNYQTGDTIVCFAEQHTGLLHKPLSQILRLNLQIPVYILSGLYPRKSTWLSQVMAWSGLIGIIFSFFMLQVKIVQLPNDWIPNILLILSIIPEFWLIWVWDSLFS